MTETQGTALTSAGPTPAGPTPTVPTPGALTTSGALTTPGAPPTPGTLPAPAAVGPTASPGPTEPAAEPADPRVEDALSRLAEVDGLPLADQVEVFTDVHRRLAAVLADPDSQA